MTVIYGPGQDRERERAVASRNSLAEMAADVYRDAPACTVPRDPEHRASDWRLRADQAADPPRPAGQWTCGVCHPYPDGLDVEGREL